MFHLVGRVCECVPVHAFSVRSLTEFIVPIATDSPLCAVVPIPPPMWSNASRKAVDLNPVDLNPTHCQEVRVCADSRLQKRGRAKSHVHTVVHTATR